MDKPVSNHAALVHSDLLINLKIIVFSHMKRSTTRLGIKIWEI